MPGDEVAVAEAAIAAVPAQAGHGIVGLVVHKFDKLKHGAATVDLRPDVIAVNPTAVRLVEQLHHLYSDRPQKGFGKFEDDQDNFPMGRFVRDYYVNKTTSFYDLSCSMMKHLEARANQEPLSTGGYVVIAHVTNGATHWLLALIVTEVLGTAITQGLEIVDSVHLDMTNLRVAGRVNLSDWVDGAERYISFLKGKSEVSTYFKLFLGCNTVLENLVESQKFTEALRAYVNSELPDAEERGRTLDLAYEHLAEMAKSQTAISLEAFANQFAPQDPKVLLGYLTQEDLSLSDGFIPDRRAIRSLATFKGKAKDWKLEFNRAAIRSQELDYNKADNTIVLSNVPDSLKNLLIEELSDQ